MNSYKISVKAFLEVDAQNEKDAIKRVTHILEGVEDMQINCAGILVDFFIDDHDAYKLKDLRLYKDLKLWSTEIKKGVDWMIEFKEYCKNQEKYDDMENNNFRSDRNYDRLKTVVYVKILSSKLENEVLVKWPINLKKSMP